MWYTNFNLNKKIQEVLKCTLIHFIVQSVSCVYLYVAIVIHRLVNNRFFNSVFGKHGIFPCQSYTYSIQSFSFDCDCQHCVSGSVQPCHFL